jgi:ribosome-binding protein aMBF1 (putative translation factor)
MEAVTSMRCRDTSAIFASLRHNSPKSNLSCVYSTRVDGKNPGMRENHPKVPSKEKAQLAFGSALRGFREAQGLTQEELAEAAGLHTNYVSSVERGERNLSLHNIARLASALGISALSLMRSLDP